MKIFSKNDISTCSKLKLVQLLGQNSDFSKVLLNISKKLSKENLCNFHGINCDAFNIQIRRPDRVLCQHLKSLKFNYPVHRLAGCWWAETSLSSFLHETPPLNPPNSFIWTTMSIILPPSHPSFQILVFPSPRNPHRHIFPSFSYLVPRNSPVSSPLIFPLNPPGFPHCTQLPRDPTSYRG